MRRGLAAQAGLPEEVATRMRDALKAATEDEEFRAHADANGFLVSWADGPAWAAQAQAQQGELAKLWSTDPWLSVGGG
jgi:tripartite-type tricarboxylate transporter receptor subunit TctC